LNFPFYIAKRYLISKKSHNIINIISAISVAGISVGTMALIVVLSVFNGFEDLVTSLFNSFNPDLVIKASEGKTFHTSALDTVSIRNINGVLYYTEVVEENALIQNQGKQHIVTIKGVGNDYRKMTGIDSAVFTGEYRIEQNKNTGLLGAGVAYYLDVNLYDYTGLLSLYVPNRNANPGLGFENAFNQGVIIPTGIFSIQQDIDTKYVLVPISLTRKLLGYTDEATSIELGLDENADPDEIKKQILSVTGPGFTVKNRYEQQELLFSIMKSEKWVVFLILTFILVIATFNMVGSLTMLILDKKKDIGILHSIGASEKTIRKIFYSEGVIITTISAFAGVIAGALICLAQQTFGIIKLGNGQGTFVIDAYPVKMEFPDFIFVTLTVIIIGLLASWFPVRQVTLRNNQVLNFRRG